MCARVLQLVLAAMFVYVVVTVAAFVYLEWWQAILVSVVTMFLIVFVAKMMIRSAIGRLGSFAKEMFSVKSRVLRNATVEVHTVRPTDVPAKFVEELNELAIPDPDDDDEIGEDRRDTERAVRDYSWYEIEATIFPDPCEAGPMKHWDVDDLKLVPANAKPEEPFGEGEDEDRPEFELHDLQLVADGVAEAVDNSKLHGPHRLRFTSGFPRTVREVKFQYYFEQFGHVRLESAFRR